MIRIAVFICLQFVIQNLSSQPAFSKLIGREGVSEFPRGMVRLDDGSVIIQVRTIYDGFNYTFGWIHADLNGDTISTFLYNMPTLRDDGINSLAVKEDTIFQLIKHRDSVYHIRIQGSSIAGDSLLRWDFDWKKNNWRGIWTSILHKTFDGDFLIVATAQKTSVNKWDIIAVLVAADGTEKWRKIIVEDYEPVDFDVELLTAWTIAETDNRYYISTKNNSGFFSNSADIFKLDKTGELLDRFILSPRGYSDDLNPIALTENKQFIYYANSRIIRPNDLVGTGLEMHQITNPNMVVGLIDTLGNLIWDRPVIMPENNWLSSFSGKTMRNGDFVVCGLWEIFFDRHGFIARYNQQGDLIWRYILPQSFGPGQIVYWMVDFVEDEEGNLLFSGEMDDRTINYPYNQDVWLLKIPGTGCETPLFCNNDTILSSIRLLPEIINDGIKVELYPNPVFPGQSIHLNVYGTLDGVISLEWIDLGGKTLYREQVEPVITKKIKVPSNLTVGFYLLKISDARGRTANAKVMIWESK